jgi:hypothetical protein
MILSVCTVVLIQRVHQNLATGDEKPEVVGGIYRLAE